MGEILMAAEGASRHQDLTEEVLRQVTRPGSASWAEEKHFPSIPAEIIIERSLEHSHCSLIVTCHAGAAQIIVTPSSLLHH